MRLGYVRALDGVRGVAIVLVIASHSFSLTGGTLGVDLFFVLSGFLITTLLLEERDVADRISLSAFYVRRARRLIPALAVLLATYLVVEAALGRNSLRIVAELGLYTGNAFRAFTSIPQNGLEHLWSLAAEEQFYLVWPVVLILLAKTRRALAIVIVVAVVAMVYRAALAAGGASHLRLYLGPDTHADGLLIGAAAAMLRRRGWAAGENTAAFGIVVVALGVVSRSVIANSHARWWDALGLPLFELGAAAFISAAIAPTGLNRMLSARPLVWLGVISYSLYLWQLPFQFWLPGHSLLAIVLAIAAAWASFRFVERPFRLRRNKKVPAEAGLPALGLAAPSGGSG